MKSVAEQSVVVRSNEFTKLPDCFVCVNRDN